MPSQSSNTNQESLQRFHGISIETLPKGERCTFFVGMCGVERCKGFSSPVAGDIATCKWSRSRPNWNRPCCLWGLASRPITAGCRQRAADRAAASRPGSIVGTSFSPGDPIWPSPLPLRPPPLCLPECALPVVTHPTPCALFVRRSPAPPPTADPHCPVGCACSPSSVTATPPPSLSLPRTKDVVGGGGGRLCHLPSPLLPRQDCGPARPTPTALVAAAAAASTTSHRRQPAPSHLPRGSHLDQWSP